MGLPAARHRDLCTGHGCFPPRPNKDASKDVFTNNRGQHRVGDGWEKHKCAKISAHGGSTVSGSSTVFVDSKPAARVQDGVSCGSRIMTGSGDVFIG